MQASADRPRFRQDLVAEPIEDGGSKFIDVMDPDSGTLFRFFEVEYSLACAMDGQRDVAGIVRWAEEELGLKPSANEVKTVIATLGDLGYLDGAAGAAAAASAPAAAASPPAAAAKPAAAPPAAAAKPAATPPAKPAAQRPATPAAGVKKAPEQPAFNRWDAPTAMGDPDEYLQHGVVTGAKSHAPSGADVELGAPGARTAKGSGEDLPRGEFELGAPGTAGAAASRSGGMKGADIALGASGASGVSVDLADHVDLSANDVKEAVRASQVMKAVDVPPELASEIETKPAKPAAKVEAKPAAKAEAKPAAKVEPKPAEKPAAKAEAKPAAKPAEKPAAKPVDKRPAEGPRPGPPAPRQSVSPVLIAALVIAILAAGGFAVYKFVIKKNSSATESTKVTPPPVKKPEPPKPPPVESEKLAVEQPAPEELKPSGAGQVAMIVASDAMVKAGDPVARLVGFKSLEADTKAAQTAVDKAKVDSGVAEKERDAAQSAGNNAGVANAEKKLAAAQKAQADNEKKLADKQAALDKFLIKAPADGKVTAVAKANAKITPTDVVATLTRNPILVTTFKKADGATQDAPVLLAVKGSAQKLACTVVQASPEGTKIACPNDASTEGTEVTFAGVDPNRPTTPPDNGGTPTPPANGSAAPTGDTGSAAPTGAGSAAPTGAGSAAVAPKKAPAPRPRPRPHAPPADKGSAAATPPAGGETAPTPTPAPAPAPAPAPGGLQ